MGGGVVIREFVESKGSSFRTYDSPASRWIHNVSLQVVHKRFLVSILNWVRLLTDVDVSCCCHGRSRRDCGLVFAGSSRGRPCVCHSVDF